MVDSLSWHLGSGIRSRISRPGQQPGPTSWSWDTYFWSSWRLCSNRWFYFYFYLLSFETYSFHSALQTIACFISFTRPNPPPTSRRTNWYYSPVNWKGFRNLLTPTSGTIVVFAGTSPYLLLALPTLLSESYLTPHRSLPGLPNSRMSQPCARPWCTLEELSTSHLIPLAQFRLVTPLLAS